MWNMSDWLLWSGRPSSSWDVRFVWGFISPDLHCFYDLSFWFSFTRSTRVGSNWTSYPDVQKSQWWGETSKKRRPVVFHCFRWSWAVAATAPVKRPGLYDVMWPLTSAIYLKSNHVCHVSLQTMSWCHICAFTLAFYVTCRVCWRIGSCKSSGHEPRNEAPIFRRDCSELLHREPDSILKTFWISVFSFQWKTKEAGWRRGLWLPEASSRRWSALLSSQVSVLVTRQLVERRRGRRRGTEATVDSDVLAPRSQRSAHARHAGLRLLKLTRGIKCHTKLWTFWTPACALCCFPHWRKNDHFKRF